MTDDEIKAIVTGFEARTLPRAEWTHGRHLVVALWYLSRLDRDEATRRMRDGLIAYNRAQGAERGYHETITLAWMEIIRRFLDSRDRSRPVAELARELLDAVGSSRYLERHYSAEALQSQAAREGWVPPDRADFDG